MFKKWPLPARMQIRHLCAKGKTESRSSEEVCKMARKRGVVAQNNPNMGSLTHSHTDRERERERAKAKDR